ncbi:MAG: AraC family transcriptional regulator [Panacagrimonas sp.]|nr:AraC family transcriptional regulator [Panacagrimonas sp.]MCC2658701.1 AraC family transcriptional regulator [Panacagrimonas sp.]
MSSILGESGEAVFSAVLRANQLHARISTSASYCDNWTDPEPATEFGTFHLIDSGVCWVRSNALPQPVRLAAGDLVLFPDGAAHLLAASADPRSPPETRFTSMLCGEFSFATGKRNAIIDALPSCLVVREQESGMQFRQLAQLMLYEARSTSFGSRTVIDKMADTLFVMAVRHYIEHAAERRGLLAALYDPRLSRALEALHSKPGHDWSVASLADIANMSRTAFAKHFGDVLGTGPIEYLTQWRMMEAKRLLTEPRMSVAAIADRLGYQTEAAFRRAFKRVTGVGPGQVRRRAGLIDEGSDDEESAG